MSAQESSPDPVTIDVLNIGGIDEASVELRPGVTVLEGRNATNRTSFMQAVMGVLGSDDVSIKGDADHARVELSTGDRSFTRTFERVDGRVRSGGRPMFEDPTPADLFSFLLESNAARRAVSLDGDLREIVMGPVDVEAIRANVESLVEERQRLDDEIERIEEEAGRLPELERRRSRIASRIEDKEDELANRREEIEAENLERTRANERELETKLDELQSARSELEDVRYSLETERETLQNLREERSEVASRLEGLPETPAGKLAETEDRLSELRNRKRSVESAVSELQRILEFNRETLEGTNETIASALRDGSETALGTDKLVAGDRVTCWTCGNAVPRADVEATIEDLRVLHEEKRRERTDIEAEIGDVGDRKRELESKQGERTRLERDLDELSDRVERREAAIEGLEADLDAAHERIDELEREVDSLEAEDHSDVLAVHREANQLEFELDQLREDLADVDGEIERIERRLDEAEDLRAERTDVRERLRSERTRVERIEREAVEAFNEHMDDVLDVLEYGNLARIWIEHTESRALGGRRKERKSTFDLHVVRSDESGTAYRDTVDHLSESEREVTGLVFALAGYLAHDVYEDVPIMLLDSLEAIDSGRIASLVDYFSDFPEFLVVALLPEDARTLDDDYGYVETI
jgi:predicted  nucleic acid-binding Zn-ribbon protein